MLTPLRSYTSADEAYLVQGLLDNNGIKAVVQNTGTNSVFPSLDESDQGVLLYVDDSQLKEAEELLRSHGD